MTGRVGMPGRVQQVVVTDVNGTAGAAALGALAASEALIGHVAGQAVPIAVEFTRTTGTTGYHANDAVLPAAGGLVEIPLVARVNGGSVYLVGAKLTSNQKSITPAWRVHFFNASNPTIAADGANWLEMYADSAKRLVPVDLPAMSTAADATTSDMSRCYDMTLRVLAVCAAATKSLWFGLECLSAFTPASGEKFTLTTFWEQN